MDGSITYTDPSRPPIAWLGGRHAEALLVKYGSAWRGHDHWPRVWAARGLLYVWRADAESSVVKGLSDPEWRVREMSAKVVRLREVADAEPSLISLVGDQTPRVRVAAVRALGRVGEVEHVDVLAKRKGDADPAVRRAAGTAMGELARRLDLTL